MSAAPQAPPAAVQRIRPIDRLRALAAERGWRVGLREADLFRGWVLRVVGSDGRELALSSCVGVDRAGAVDAGALGLCEALGAAVAARS